MDPDRTRHFRLMSMPDETREIAPNLNGRQRLLADAILLERTAVVLLRRGGAAATVTYLKSTARYWRDLAEEE